MLCVYPLRKVLCIYSGHTVANNFGFKLYISWSSDFSKVKKEIATSVWTTYLILFL